MGSNDRKRRSLLRRRPHPAPAASPRGRPRRRRLRRRRLRRRCTSGPRPAFPPGRPVLGAAGRRAGASRGDAAALQRAHPEQCPWPPRDPRSPMRAATSRSSAASTMCRVCSPSPSGPPARMKPSLASPSMNAACSCQPSCSGDAPAGVQVRRCHGRWSARRWPWPKRYAAAPTLPPPWAPGRPDRGSRGGGLRVQPRRVRSELGEPRRGQECTPPAPALGLVLRPLRVERRRSRAGGRPGPAAASLLACPRQPGGDSRRRQTVRRGGHRHRRSAVAGVVDRRRSRPRSA